MRCTLCGCPGAYPLLIGVVCWSRKCRNFKQEVVSRSDFSYDSQLVNGDSIEELKEFLGSESEWVF